jgi:hypothetical protein
MQKSNLLLTIILVLLFSSCGVQQSAVDYNKLQVMQSGPSERLTANQHSLIAFQKVHDKTAVLSPKILNLVKGKSILNPAKKLRKPAADDCDYILLKNGEEIGGKVLEVGSTEIKYKKCDNPDGPTYTVNKSEVFMIKYQNGTKDVFSDAKTLEEEEKTSAPVPENPADREVEMYGLIGFFAGIVGLLLPVSVLPLIIICGLVAAIFGLIGMARPKDRYKLKGFAIASFVLGVITLLLLAVIMPYI